MTETEFDSTGSPPVFYGRFRTVVLLVIVMVLAPALDAQDITSIGVYETGAKTGTALYKIAEVTIIIEGDRTSERALRHFLDIVEGERFSSEADLAAALLIQEQDLINERVFDSVSVTYRHSGDKSKDVSVTVHVKDSWTLLPIPFISYNSNTGLKIGIETTYDNALGSMTNWALDTDITLGSDYNDQYAVKGFTINPTLTSLKIHSLRFSGGINQEYITEETGAPGGWSEYNSYYRTSLTFGTSWEFKDDWYYSFRPEIDFRYGFNWELEDTDSIEDRYNLVWNHTVGPGRINRILNNFRQGYEVKLGNSLKAVGSSLPDAFSTDFRFVTDLSLDGRIYYTPGERFNFYHSYYSYVVYNDIYRNQGEYIRGVRDSTMTGRSGIFQRNSFGINVVRWEDILNLQIHPFFDYGYTWGGTTGTSDEFRYGFGADIVLFIDKASNLVLCATIGFDPTRKFSDEIIIGTGFSY